MKEYDTIIIGSGLGWLSAWALLSKKWQRILVLEKHYIAWGYATNFKRKDYEFDVALHQIWAWSYWFKNILKKAWVYDKLEFIKHKYLYESIYPDFTIKVENWNWRKFRDDLITLFPEEKSWIKKWFFILRYTWMQIKLWDFTNKYKIFFPFVMIFAPILIPFLAFGWQIKIQDLLKYCTKNKKLQKAFMELLGYYWDDYNLSASTYLIPSYWFYFDWWYWVKWWWQAVSNAFIEVIKQNSWEVLINYEVEEIIIENDLAIWVKTKKWEFYAKNIICNASPFILYEKLLANWSWSKNELEKLNKFEIWMSLSSAYIWINTLVENLNKNFEKSYIVNFNKDESKENLFWFTITTYEDNSWIPIWKSVITVVFFDKYETRENLSKEEYKAKKLEKIEELTYKLENIFPEIRKHIEVFELGTPKTMERYTSNKYWAIYGFSQKASKLWNYGNETSIKNLFLSSAWCFWWGFEWVIRAWNEVVKNIKK